jgi:CDP-glucose 4,6-dehydratase
MENLGRRLAGTTVYVTGANGFVGSWLTHALLDGGATVVCLLHDVDPQSEFVRAGLRERTIPIEGRLQDFDLQRRVFAEYRPSTVFHLGAQTLVGEALLEPLETFESNIRGTYTLLEAARQATAATAIVVASSDKAYGTLTAERYVEEMPLRGEHPYDVSKSCTDLLAHAYWRSYALPVTVARCGNIYGGGDTNWSRLIPGTIRSLLANERPIVRSDGTLIRDYLHVNDVVQAYLALAVNTATLSLGGEAFNFSAGVEKTVLAVVGDVRRLMNRTELEPEIKADARAEIQTQILAWEKARTVLGWRPAVEYEDGLRETIAWYARALPATPDERR